MGQPPRKQQRAEKYEITLDSGEKYVITAYSDAQANELAQFIKQQAASGNAELNGVKLPGNAVVTHAQRPDVPGADYINTGGTEGQITGEGERQLDRGGVLNTIDAGMRGISNGALFNFADELVAGANALVPLDRLTGIPVNSVWDGSSFWDAFQHNKNIEDQVDIADATQHPVARGVGNVVGAVGGTILAARAARAAPGAILALPASLQRALLPAVAAAAGARAAAPVRTAIATGVLGGGGAGALAGFGAGDTLESRKQSAALGGLGGAAIGGPVSGAITVLGPAVARYASVLFGKGSDKEATRQIVTALQRDGFDVTNPTGIQALRQELQSFTGKPVSLADIGSATRSRAGVGLRAPSGAQQQSIDRVMQRAGGQTQRLSADIRATVAPRTDVHALDEALVKQRADQALPLREQALMERKVIPPEMEPVQLPAPYSEAPDAGLGRMLGDTAPAVGPVKPMDQSFMDAIAAKAEADEAATAAVPQPQQPFGPPAPTIVDRSSRMVEDETLNRLASEHPMAQRALAGATKISQAERARKQILGESLDDVPEILAGGQLDYRTADSLKRFLDDQVSRLARRADTETFTAAEYGEVKALRDAVRERMRLANDEYGQYLDSYSGTSEMRDALEEGREYSRLDPEQIAAGQADRSTAAQELYRVGAARDLTDTLRSTKDMRNPASRILNSDEARDQVAALGVAPESMARLNQSVAQERQLNLLPAELAGSQTAQRVAAAADADAGVQAAVPFNPGSPLGWLGAIGRAVTSRASLARNARVNEAALSRLLETDPAAVDSIIKELEGSGQRLQAERLRRQVAAQRTSSVLGRVIGGPVSLQEGNY